MSPVVLPENGWIQSQFSAFESSLNGSKSSDLHARRKQAFEKLLSIGFPSSKVEDWKYTSLRELLKQEYRLESKAASLDTQLYNQVLLDDHPIRLTFINGHFSEEHSDLSVVPDNSVILPLKEAFQKTTEITEKYLGRNLPEGEQSFVELNTAFLQDGALIHLKKGVQLGDAIQLVFVNTGADRAAFIHPRVLIVAEEGSSARVTETHTGKGQYLTSPVTEVYVEPNAHVDHYRIQLESEQSFHVGSVHVTQEQDSNFRTHTFHFGGQMVRAEVWPQLRGSNIVSTLNGLTVINGKQHVDNFTVIDHAEPHCESHELYKGIYDDNSSGAFSGTIIVRPDAQKTNAYQSNQSILLSDTANSHSKPQLKIWADDVRCSHGATVGQLDKEAMFYIRSRGIPEVEARNILIHAFASEVIEGVGSECLRAELEQRLLEKLRRKEE